MKNRLPLALSAVALILALLSNGSVVSASSGVIRHALFADRAGTARHATTADTATTASMIGGIRVSRHAVGGRLLPLGTNGEFPESVLPLDSTSKAPNISARVWASVPQAIPNSAGGPSTPETVLRFDRIAFDTAGLFQASAPDRLTIPVTGIYLVSASVRWDPLTSSAGERVVRIFGGNEVIADQQATTPGTPYIAVSGVSRLLAGDTVGVAAGATNDTKVITDGSDSDSSSLSVVWLAPG
jgi:hypothetical protein